MEGGAGPEYQYGRLEIFIRGFWSAVCDKKGFTPAAALVACRALGFDGGAAIQFIQSYGGSAENEVLSLSSASLLDCCGSGNSGSGVLDLEAASPRWRLMSSGKCI